MVTYQIGASDNVLNKSVTSTATIVILLQLHKLELTEGLEDVLKVGLGDAEVDVAHIQPVEGNRIGMTGRFRVADLAVLLGLGGLDNDRDT